MRTDGQSLAGANCTELVGVQDETGAQILPARVALMLDQVALRQRRIALAGVADQACAALISGIVVDKGVVCSCLSESLGFKPGQQRV